MATKAKRLFGSSLSISRPSMPPKQTSFSRSPCRRTRRTSFAVFLDWTTNRTCLAILLNFTRRLNNLMIKRQGTPTKQLKNNYWIRISNLLIGNLIQERRHRIWMVFPCRVQLSILPKNWPKRLKDCMITSMFTNLMRFLWTKSDNLLSMSKAILVIVWRLGNLIKYAMKADLLNKENLFLLKTSCIKWTNINPAKVSNWRNRKMKILRKIVALIKTLLQFCKLSLMINLITLLNRCSENGLKYQ